MNTAYDDDDQCYRCANEVPRSQQYYLSMRGPDHENWYLLCKRCTDDVEKVLEGLDNG